MFDLPAAGSMNKSSQFDLQDKASSNWSTFSATAIILILLFTAQLIHYTIKAVREFKDDRLLVAKHGCMPPPQLPNRWPLGVDRLKELWKSNSEGHLLAFLCSVATDYEPRNNLSQYMLFGPRVFHTLHPKNVEAVLSTNFKDFGFGVRASVFAPLLGNGIFTQEGSAWKHSREILRKLFLQTEYRKLDEFREHVDNLIARLPLQGGVIDLQPLFFSLTLDTTTALLLGKSVYSLKAGAIDEEENRDFAENFNIAQEGLAKRFRIAPWHFFYSPARFRRACSIAHRFVETYIKQSHLADQNEKDTQKFHGFIKDVSQMSENDEDVRDQLLNVLLAGRDTTACCLSWTFRLLVRHENVMTRLREEIISVMGDSQYPTREQVRKMPYLSCVIKESLRLYPPVPLNNRTAVRSTVLPTGGGPDGTSPILVRRGELVIFSQYVNSRKKNLYGPDADDFRPARWETGELSSIGWAYFPFNGGPRTCLGQDFALMETSYTVIRLLQTVKDISMPRHEKLEPVGTEKQRLTLVLSSADGCRVAINQQK